MNKRVLILCTGNSARSQMAEGFLRSLDPGLDVHSAGTVPAPQVNPHAVAVMDEIGISLSAHFPKSVERYLREPFDYVITVCGSADQACPGFTGRVGQRLHIGFEDPAAAAGTAEAVRSEFRRVREEIRARFAEFYREISEGGQS
jgi:arsenate reductase